MARPSAREARVEAEAVEADRRAQEVGPGLTTNPSARVARTYVRATSPDGVDVVFVPGEALPAWVLAAMTGARVDADGVVTVRGTA
ncbi:MAG: hypothetical protein ACT4QG_09285 [Sporichthyaceae bacterium]